MGEQAGEVGLKVSECLTFRWQEIICEPRIRHREPWFESRRPSVERKGWRVRTSQRREAWSAMTQHKQQWRSLAALGPSGLLEGRSWRVSSDLGSVEAPGLKAVDFCAQIRLLGCGPLDFCLPRAPITQLREILGDHAPPVVLRELTSCFSF